MAIQDRNKRQETRKIETTKIEYCAKPSCIHEPKEHPEGGKCQVNHCECKSYMKG